MHFMDYERQLSAQNDNLVASKGKIYIYIYIYIRVYGFSEVWVRLSSSNSVSKHAKMSHQTPRVRTPLYQTRHWGIPLSL